MLLSQASGASSTYTTLSAIGVQLQKDGSLKLDDTKVAAALADLPELTKALSNVDPTTPANNGFAKKFALWTDQLLSVSGSVPGKTKALQARITSNQKDQDRMTDRLALAEQRLRAQYSALDSTMASANALSKYVTQQIATWNKSKD
jgi:flagellar hook-associated protein 2